MCNWSCEYFVMFYKAQDEKTNGKTVKMNTAQKSQTKTLLKK